MPFKASISPFIATPLAIPYGDVMLSQRRTFPDDAALPQLCGLDRADTSDLSTRYTSLTAPIYCQGPSIPSDE
jgi:hypothetical protein